MAFRFHEVSPWLFWRPGADLYTPSLDRDGHIIFVWLRRVVLNERQNLAHIRAPKGPFAQVLVIFMQPFPYPVFPDLPRSFVERERPEKRDRDGRCKTLVPHGVIGGKVDA